MVSSSTKRILLQSNLNTAPSLWSVHRVLTLALSSLWASRRGSTLGWDQNAWVFRLGQKGVRKVHEGLTQQVPILHLDSAFKGGSARISFPLLAKQVFQDWPGYLKVDYPHTTIKLHKKIIYCFSRGKYFPSANWKLPECYCQLPSSCFFKNKPLKNK